MFQVLRLLGKDSRHRTTAPPTETATRTTFPAMQRITRSAAALANATKTRTIPKTNSKKRALATTTTAITTPKKKKKKKYVKVPPLTPPSHQPKAAPKLAGDWLKTYNMVAELREDRTAPVDVFGSEALPDR
jgi:hypothetical protein